MFLYTSRACIDHKRWQLIPLTHVGMEIPLYAALHIAALEYCMAIFIAACGKQVPLSHFTQQQRKRLSGTHVALDAGVQCWNSSSYFDFLCSLAHNLPQEETSSVCLHSASAAAKVLQYIDFS